MSCPAKSVVLLIIHDSKPHNYPLRRRHLTCFSLDACRHRLRHIAAMLSAGLLQQAGLGRIPLILCYSFRV
jgi:hypothetical protein